MAQIQPPTDTGSSAEARQEQTLSPDTDARGNYLTHPDVTKATLTQLPLELQGVPGYLPGIFAQTEGLGYGSWTWISQVVT